MDNPESDGVLILNGPPEPVVHEEDGEQVVDVIWPTGEPATTGAPYRSQRLGTYRCLLCDHQTIEGEGFVDGKIKPPKKCPECERKGRWAHVGDLSEEEAQAAARAEDIWHPPSGLDDARIGALWDDIEEYIRDHWDADEDAIYAGLTAFALSTWLRPALDFVPHLMLMGHTTGGKTRLLNTLARVSYRAVVSASATPASMFRMVDAYNVTFYVSEYHGLDADSQRELDNIIRAGQKRGEIVTRAEKTASGHEPRSYDPFTHAAVATQYTPNDDIVNRCIQVHSSPTDRDMPATHDEDRAEEIRNRLLFARYRLLESDEWAECEQGAYEYLAEHDIKDRPREKLLSLVTVAIRWARLDDRFHEFVELVCEQDREAAASSEDALIIEAVRDLALEEIENQAFIGEGDAFAGLEVRYSDVLERYEEVTGVEKTAAWLGHVRKRLGLESERKADGTVISDPDLGRKLRRLCETHNLDWERSEEADSDEIADPRHTVKSHIEDHYDPGDEFTPSQVADDLLTADLTPEQVGHQLTRMVHQRELTRDGETYARI